MKIIHQNLEPGRSRAIVVREFDKIDQFIHTNKAFDKSETFFCRNVIWFLALEKDSTKTTNGTDDILSVFLFAQNIIDTDSDWEIKAFFKITMLGKSENQTKIDRARFGRYSFWGTTFIINEFFNETFVKNDKIKFEIDLEADKLMIKNDLKLKRMVWAIKNNDLDD